MVVPCTFLWLLKNENFNENLGKTSQATDLKVKESSALTKGKSGNNFKFLLKSNFFPLWFAFCANPLLS